MQRSWHTQRAATGRVAFVTGAGSGIGRATALAFAAQGAHVTAVGLSADDVSETAQLIDQHGGRALAVTCDVTRPDDIRATLDQTIDTFGRLDFAFNNAGIEQSHTATTDITTDEWNRLLAINLTGVFLCMKHEIPLIKAAGGGLSSTPPPAPESSASPSKPHTPPRSGAFSDSPSPQRWTTPTPASVSTLSAPASSTRP